MHLKDQADLPGARAVLEAIQVQGLAEYLGQPAPAAPRYAYRVPEVKDPRQPVSAMDFQDPLAVLGHPVGGHEREPAARGTR